ncbi:MAG: hypothetical protein RBS68_14710 [Anaerolineales bacterium]|jgi:hypothetical protein|nr:hypothetical protein [Anaerolineales bacterium]
MTVSTITILGEVAEALQLPEDDLIRKSVHSYLERQLRAVQAEIFEITSRYTVTGVEEMDGRYRDGTLEEADSWQDLQRLDRLEYKRDQLKKYLESLS